MNNKKILSADAESSRSGAGRAGSKAIENLETLNAKLMKEEEELREEIKELSHRLASVTEMVELATADLNAAEIRLLAAVREKDEKKKELAALKEGLKSLEEAKDIAEPERTWKRWMFPVAASATFLGAIAVVTVCCKSFRFKN